MTLQHFRLLLARRNMLNTKIGVDPSTSRYRVVGNRKVTWKVKGYPERKVHIGLLVVLDFK